MENPKYIVLGVMKVEMENMKKQSIKLCVEIMYSNENTSLGKKLSEGWINLKK